MKLESMSNNITDIMWSISNNAGLLRLLVYNMDNPFDTKEHDEADAKLVIKKMGNDFSKYVLNSDGKYVLPNPTGGKNILKPDSSHTKIFPFPFNPEATVEEGSFIRAYYNDGEFNDNEVIAESQINIDIIVAKSLWLINDGTRSMIRPYEIAGRVIDMVGRRSVGNTVKLNFQGYQHLYINSKFDAFRLYANYMSVET